MEDFAMHEFDKTIDLKDNAILKTRPELFGEWDFKKNNDLGLDVYKVTKGMVKKAWWICLKCESSFETRIDARKNGQNCPYCAGKKVNHTNSLASLRLDLSSEWHPTKNGVLTPHDVTCSSLKKVWWNCKYDHTYESCISDRNSNKNCPICSNRKIQIGFNDIWTTHPNIAKLMSNSEDGYKYTYGSKIKVNFKCPDCSETIIDKAINKVYANGLSCPKCSDGYSYPEKIMYGLLSQLDMDFTPQKIFNWAANKKYDFYLPEQNMIIETHGRQHKEQGFKMLGARTLQEEQENDSYKRELALANGVKLYVEIDCSNSDLNYIKSSILNTIIINHFDLKDVNWDLISFNASKSKLVEVCDFYNKNYMTQKEMSHQLKISDSTIRDYLTTGSKLGLCSYEPNSHKNKMISVKHKEKIVVQLDLNGKLINQWDSIRLAGRSLNKDSSSSISACCKGKAKKAFGFKWMYKEDYENMIKENEIAV
jgi:predicted RNA-binding Zn-ribbon protein involved in translation (DUF1610 family)